jgi:hypothetical protein
MVSLSPYEISETISAFSFIPSAKFCVNLVEEAVPRKRAIT